MVTGRRPYKAKSLPELMLKAISQPTPRPSSLDRLPHDIPQELELLILCCMAKRADQRIQTMTEVKQRLEELATSVEAPDRLFTLPPMERLIDPPSNITAQSSLIVPASHAKTRALILGLGAAVLALAVALAVVFTHSEETSAATAPIPAPVVEEAGTVNIGFDSTPRGAQVFVEGEGEAIGTTPFVAQLERAEQTVRYAFKLEGHETVFRAISLDKDSSSLVPLPATAPAASPDAGDRGVDTRVQKKKKRPRKRPKRKEQDKKPKSKEALIDPFAQ
jgi:hypothetical protein